MKRDEDAELIPWNCPACKSCRLVVRSVYGCSGPRQCIAGGPFTGYVQLEQTTGDPKLYRPD